MLFAAAGHSWTSVDGQTGISSCAGLRRKFIEANPMILPRAGHTATLLRDGEVLIAGGENDETATENALASSEVYDPKSWSIQGRRRNVPRSNVCCLNPTGGRTAANHGRVLRRILSNFASRTVV